MEHLKFKHYVKEVFFDSDTEMAILSGARVQTFVPALANAGLRAEAVPQIQTVEWSKDVFFLSWMVPSVLTRLETYKFLSHSDTAVIVAQLMQETALLAEKLGIPLENRGALPVKTLCSVSLTEAVGIIRRYEETMATQASAHKVSTLQDLERSRRFETSVSSARFMRTQYVVLLLTEGQRQGGIDVLVAVQFHPETAHGWDISSCSAAALLRMSSSTHFGLWM